jgi:hypothetical protein
LPGIVTGEELSDELSTEFPAAFVEITVIE